MLFLPLLQGSHLSLPCCPASAPAGRTREGEDCALCVATCRARPGQVYTAASQVSLSEDLGELGSAKSCGKKADVKC